MSVRTVDAWLLTLSQTSPGFYVSAVKVSLKHWGGRGEIAHNEQFLLFPQCFQPFQRTFSHFHKISHCRLQILSVWNSPKFVVWERVKGGPSDLGTKILQKYQKSNLMLLKPFDFHS